MQTFHDIDAAAQALEAADPATFRGKVAIVHSCSPYLNPAVLALVNMAGDEVHGATCGVMDVLCRSSQPYSAPVGRHFACYVSTPYGGRAWTNAVLIHEAAHYLASDNPARDEADEQKAVKLYWKTDWSKFGKHDKRWATACAHLAYRFLAAGHNVDVPALFSSYAGDGSKLIAELRPQIVGNVHRPIGAVIGSSSSKPKRSKPKASTKPKPAASTATTKPTTKPAGNRTPADYPNYCWTGSEWGIEHDDGSIESCESGKRYKSWEAYNEANAAVAS